VLAQGVRWVASSQITVQLGRLSLAIVLARILVPADFGVVSLVMIFIAFVDIALGDVGTAAAIVQRQNLTDREISSLFWFNVGVGVVSTGVAQIAAPLMDHVLDHPDVVIAFRVVALTFTVAGFRMAHLAILRRDLRYRALATADIASFVANAAVAIGLALAGAGFWSIIVGSLVSNVVMTIFVWSLSGFRPSFSYEWAHLRSVAAFSLNLSLFRVVNFFSAQGDRFLVGAYAGADSLGFYSQANRLVRYPLDTAAVVYRRVVVPAMSKDQDDNLRLRKAFLTATGVSAVTVMPFTILAAILAEPLILALPGEQWLPAVPLIRLIAMVGLLNTIAGQSGVIFQVKGRTDLLLYWGIAAASVNMTGYIIGLQWGVEGVAWGYLISMMLLVLPNFYLPLRLIDTQLRTLWPQLRGIIGAGAALGATAFVTLRLTYSTGANPWIPLIAASLAGGGVYIALLVATQNRSFLNLVEVGSPSAAKRIRALALRPRSS
jgi:O-antigen/teichoic acid export membrane protein